MTRSNSHAGCDRCDLEDMQDIPDHTCLPYTKSRVFRIYPSGIDFDPFNPRPEHINIEDIAHALALDCRFGRFIPEFYSVAQHCCLVAEALPDALRFAGQLHEVGEALSGFGDVVGPIKRHPSCGIIKNIECRIEDAASVKFGLPLGFAHAPEVKAADKFVYAWENRDLRGIAPPATLLLPKNKIVPLDWRAAKEQFLEMARKR